MDCEGFQIAIERELHGALPPDGRGELAAHLSSCEACRAYRAAAAGTERAMAERATGVIEGVDWARVERGIREGMRSTTQMVAAAAFGACFVLGMLWWAAAPAYRAEALLRAGTAMAAAVAGIGLLAWLGARRLAALERGRDMLEVLREGARARVWFGRVLPWVCLVLAARLGWKAVSSSGERLDALLFYGVLAGVLLAVGAWERFGRLPAARRELALLERDGLA